MVINSVNTKYIYLYVMVANRLTAVKMDCLCFNKPRVGILAHRPEGWKEIGDRTKYAVLVDYRHVVLTFL